MKRITFFLFTVLLPLCGAQAQAANDIVEKYIEKSGSRKVWDTLRATKMDATMKQTGVTLPLTLYNTKAGKQAIIVDFAGKRFAQLAFDGHTFWTTDLTTMTPLLGSQEITNNVRLSKNDFPSPIINYEKNYYELEYEGVETVDSVQTFKIKVIKEPLTINGQEINNVSYYYFDTQNYNPVKIEEIKPDGQFVISRLSDYQDVHGLSFPFTIKQDSTVIQIKNITLNPEIDGKVFEFPQSDY
ncbi:MAG TPA: hypothetical protein ENH91_13345 [Leeuwenhoekiella sp.]|nr:hypothetical protein [Leeuwenhoekiella sp.]